MYLRHTPELNLIPQQSFVEPFSRRDSWGSIVVGDQVGLVDMVSHNLMLI